MYWKVYENLKIINSLLFETKMSIEFIDHKSASIILTVSFPYINKKNKIHNNYLKYVYVYYSKNPFVIIINISI